MRHIFKYIPFWLLIVSTYTLALPETALGQGVTSAAPSPQAVTPTPIPSATSVPSSTIPSVGNTMSAVSAPSGELSGWLGLVGGLIGISSGVTTFLIMWRNRRRIVFRVITTAIYWGEWGQWDVDNSGTWPGMPGATASYKSGDCRRIFQVLEILIRNEYPAEISVGRFVIDGWMYADHHERGDTKWKKDYRVYNLHSHEATGLDKYVKIPPHGSYGLRIEILDEANGPTYEGSHTRYTVEIPKESIIEFYTDVGQRRKVVRYSKPIQVWVWKDDQIYDVYHLSDLLPPNVASSWLPKPQGVKDPPPKRYISLKLHNWIHAIYSWCVYGTKYHIPGQPNRLAKAWRDKVK